MSTPVKHHSPGFLAIVSDAKTRIREIGIEEYKRLKQRGEAGQLVDVREKEEFDKAHAAGAIHLSKGVIERDIEKTIPDKNAKLVLYCGGGYRSALATDNLQKMGYTNVISLDGGWRAIEVSGLPLQRAEV
ncbi:MAG: sulfurtransferase [Acidobacteriaceae bacterium]|nr:sulfurtransferase [Acidobacteriaceae bacterium]